MQRQKELPDDTHSLSTAGKPPCRENYGGESAELAKETNVEEEQERED